MKKVRTWVGPMGRNFYGLKGIEGRDRVQEGFFYAIMTSRTVTAFRSLYKCQISISGPTVG